MRVTPRDPDASVNQPKVHPLADVSILLVATVAIVVGFAAVVGFATDLVAASVSFETEREIFEPIAPSIVAAVEEEGVDPGASQALQALLDRVLAQLDPLPLTLQARVLCTDLPNAFAMPGGLIAVTSGLLRELETEHELAFVLGHEVGHFTNRDHLRGLGRGIALGILLQAALSVASVSGDDVVAAAVHGATRAHGRGQEIAADELGVQALGGLYGHTGGAARVFEALARATGETWVDQLDFLRTHPVSERRVEAMRAYAAERGLTEQAVTTPLPDVLRLACSEDTAAE